MRLLPKQRDYVIAVLDKERRLQEITRRGYSDSDKHHLQAAQYGMKVDALSAAIRHLEDAALEEES
jgi:hypothetical protein